MNIPDTLYVLLTGLVGFATAVVTVWVTKRRVAAETSQAKAEASSVLTEAALALVTPLSERIASLEEEVRLLREKIEEQSVIEDGMRAEALRKDKRIRHLEEVCKRAGINGD